MAGNGPAPADPGQRRRRNAPTRGEWIELPPLEKPVLPALPKRARGEGAWPPITRAVWNAWRRDPVTAQWSVSDIAYALDAIRLHAVMTPATASEVRLRMDALGLTPKGKRDLRWRLAEPESAAPA
jgi:hypothetical protein